MIVLFRFSTAVIKSHGQEQHGEERVCFNLQFPFSVHCWGRNSRQEARGRTWSRSHGEVLLPGLCLMAYSACFLAYSSQDHQPRLTTHGELGPPKSPISQENAPQSCSQANLVGTFLSWGSLFSNDSNLYGVDIKLTNRHTGLRSQFTNTYQWPKPMSIGC